MFFVYCEVFRYDLFVEVLSNCACGQGKRTAEDFSTVVQWLRVPEHRDMLAPVDLALRSLKWHVFWSDLLERLRVPGNASTDTPIALVRASVVASGGVGNVFDAVPVEFRTQLHQHKPPQPPPHGQEHEQQPVREQDEQQKPQEEQPVLAKPLTVTGPAPYDSITFPQ